MTLADIPAQRLHNQHLLRGLGSADDVVRALGAVQAQDVVGAQWALGQRTRHATNADVTRLYNEGKILRTHMLRPTWHFVTPEDIGWMQALTAPRVQTFNAYYYKKEGLDEDAFAKAERVLVTALQGGNHLTRKQVREVLAATGIQASGLRLACVMMHAELSGLVCSGVMQGKQHTVALLRERAPQAARLSRPQALAELTKRFYTAHGPATIRDFAWWSSLSVADIKEGIQLAGLPSLTVDDTTFYYANKTSTSLPSPVVHLLPNYDEFLIAYKERRPFSQHHLHPAPSYLDLRSHFVLLDGQLVGGWQRQVTAKTYTVHLKLFATLTPSQAEALELARQRLEAFTGLPVTLVS